MTTSAQRELDATLLSQEQAMELLQLPRGLKAETVAIGRKPVIVEDGDGYVVKLNRDQEFPLTTAEGRDSMFELAGIPKGLAKSTPSKLMMPVLAHQLARQERVIAFSDEQNGLLRLESPKDMHPSLEPEPVLQHIYDQYPEVLYQKAEVTKDFQADLLAITHNDVHKLEELLQPGQHKFLPKDGDPFRAGVHLRFSPIGVVEPLIEPYMVRLICTNGAIHQEFMTSWGPGYGEGDDMWAWFRQGMAQAHASVNAVMGQYAGLVGEEIKAGQDRTLAVEGMIRAARLPAGMANGLRDLAIADPPRTQYELWNHLTAVATHNSKGFGEQLRRMTVAGNQVEPNQHRQFCINCGRS